MNLRYALGNHIANLCREHTTIRFGQTLEFTVSWIPFRIPGRGRRGWPMDKSRLVQSIGDTFKHRPYIQLRQFS